MELPEEKTSIKDLPKYLKDLFDVNSVGDIMNLIIEFNETEILLLKLLEFFLINEEYNFLLDELDSIVVSGNENEIYSLNDLFPDSDSGSTTNDSTNSDSTSSESTSY